MKRRIAAPAFVLLVCLLLVTTITYGSTIVEAIFYDTGRLFDRVGNAHSQFRASYLCTSETGYNTVPGKHIKRCWVRLQEGTSDTGRHYSWIALNTADSGQYTADTSLGNNPLYNMQFTYGWEYF